jgi:hypothetical protein
MCFLIASSANIPSVDNTLADVTPIARLSSPKPRYFKYIANPIDTGVAKILAKKTVLVSRLADSALLRYMFKFANGNASIITIKNKAIEAFSPVFP